MIAAVTGSSGFLGTALIEYLTALGHSVVPVKRYQLGDVNVLRNLLDSERVDQVFHLAAYGNHANQTDHKEIIRVNVLYSLNVFKAAIGRKVFNFSSSSVTLPVKTLYSITKRAAEEMAEAFQGIVNVRPYSVYGPREAAHRFIPTVCRALKTGERITLDASATHDWIYVNDAIEALLNGHTELGTGEKRTNLEIVQKLEEISGKRLNYVAGSLRNYDNADWVAKSGVEHRSIERGLSITWDFYDRT